MFSCGDPLLATPGSGLVAEAGVPQRVDEPRPGPIRRGSPGAGDVAQANKDTSLIAVIDRRALGRETFTRALETADGRFGSRAFAEIDDWLVDPYRRDTAAILRGIGGASGNDPGLVEDLQLLARDHPRIPAIVVGDREDPSHVLEILSHGARGYIPTSLNLGIAIGAVSLVMAGGVFVPASTLLDASRAYREPPPDAVTLFGLTERQAAIAEGLACGKPNKIIAYELSLCESTVKVHIRTIMKKLQARNRTEVAFKLHAARVRPAASARTWTPNHNRDVGNRSAVRSH